jgi:trk system potassium uptake protein TrkA
VIEVKIFDDSILANRPLQESAAGLPVSVVFGGVTRIGDYLQPRGDSGLEVGDHAVIFVDSPHVADISDQL